MPASPSARLGVRARTTLLGIARAAIARRLDRAAGASDSARCPVEGDEIARPAAVFVTLKRDDRLRGCIGTLEAQAPLWRAVADTSERAAFEDPRFPPLEAAELEYVSIHLSVIGRRRRVTLPEEIRLGIDGVILERGAARAVFLPQVALEQRWGVRQLLEHLARKAGLDADAWQAAELHAFEVEAFGEASEGDQDAGG
jgi:AmmeMemoRadiSam system protein A